MTEKPLVSVVIPTRDRHEPLLVAVRSVLEQTFDRLEVWVVDDGSAAPVVLPASLTSDGRVHVIRVERSRGQGAARNLGVERSSGELLAWLDDDDRWLPDKLERQVPALISHDADVGAVECGYEFISSGRVILRHLPREDRDLRYALLYEAVMSPSAVLMRRAAFHAVGGFDETLKRMQDWDLWLRLADHYRVISIPEVHVVRTLHRASPEDILRFRRAIRSRISHRIDALPEPQRRSVEAHHLFMEGVLLAETRDPAGARSTLWRAWKRSRNPRPLMHILRTVTGEAAWGRVRDGSRAAVRAIRRVAGKGPPVKRW